ncbi:MAG TPA: hypothetical protein VED84_03210 [Acidimicrobiales bacterium]|nr:hypothetical protein [Acidimicrobiales bacterium]
MSLATSALDQDGSVDLAAWALAKGRLLDPDGEELYGFEAGLRAPGVGLPKSTVQFGATLGGVVPSHDVLNAGKPPT